MIQRGTVETNLAPQRTPDTDEKAGKRGFPGGARPDDAEASPRLKREGDIRHNQPLSPGWRRGHGLDREAGGRRRQPHPVLRGRKGGEKVLEALPALPCADEALPVRDGELDRGQGSGSQDRARDDDPGRRLLVDHQVGADAERRRLQRHPEDLRHRAEAAGDIGRLLLARHVAVIRLRPERAEAPPHAHRVEHLRVAATGFCERIAILREADHHLGGAPRLHVRQDRQPDQENGPNHRGDADPGVEGEADRQVERDPGKVEQCRRTEPGQEAANLVKISQGLEAIADLPRFQGKLRERREDPLAKRAIDRRPDPDQDATAQKVQDSLKSVHRQGQNG